MNQSIEKELSTFLVLSFEKSNFLIFRGPQKHPFKAKRLKFWILDLKVCLKKTRPWTVHSKNFVLYLSTTSSILSEDMIALFRR